MTDALESAHAKLLEQVGPFLDSAALRAAGLQPDALVKGSLAAVISELSHNFVLAPRQSLLALIRERDARPGNAEGLVNRVVMLEMALATARLR